jgi:hypothetical protein
MSRADAGIRMLYQLGQLLRRRVWRPLQRSIETFHVLPAIAALLIFLLFAYDGQIREVYISYVEALHNTGLDNGSTTAAALRIMAALAGLALLSAMLSEAHFSLSAMRIGVVYSKLSDPEAHSLLRTLRRSAGIFLALAPWVGVASGLAHAKNYVENVYPQLRSAGIDPSEIEAMQRMLPLIQILYVIVPLLFLALVTGVLVDRYRRNSAVRNTLFAVMPFAAAALFLHLTSAQYGAWQTVQTTGTLMALLLVGLGYYLSYYYICFTRPGFIYAPRLRLDIGITRQERQRIALFAWAAVPWLAIAAYFSIRGVGELASPPIHYLPTIGRWAIFAVAEVWVIAAGLLVAITLESFSETRALRGAIVTSVALLMLTAGIASGLSADFVVELYRLIGPIGSVSLALLFVFSVVTLLAILSQKSGFPALTLLFLAVVVSALFPISINVTATALAITCAILAVMAVFSRLWSVAVIATVLVIPGITTWLEKARSEIIRQNSEAAGPGLGESFRDWLRERPNLVEYADRDGYPVFIIAVEGGGIYAATAAALFLGDLEDANPSFSQHVFAISGVSGGAIGASVFHALDRAMVGPDSRSSDRARGSGAGDLLKSCVQFNEPGAPAVRPYRLSPMVSKVMQGDHLSPVIGAIFPDLIGGLGLSRPQVLGASFRSSVRSTFSEAARELDKCFVDHWSPTSLAPALVLNATWAETGFRVAFAPFRLHGDDDSLYAFTDKNMPDVRHVTVMEAAVVSARFPGILPPFSVAMQGVGGELRWNFVDGGYSDSTGASTALALYRALKPEAVANHADLRIILLTSSDPQPDLNPKRVSITGTEFRDTLAPIAAVMKVREGQSNQAVARVCEEFHMNRNCRRQSGVPNSPLKIVGINDELYGLPLGWKLSRTTFEVVRHILGDPRSCASIENVKDDEIPSPEDDDTDLTRQTFANNSCVLKFVAELLNAGRHGRR